MSVKKTFDPSQWNKKGQNNNKTIEKPQDIGNSLNADVEKVIAEIENRQYDITAGYETWRNIGFAFENAFGESGRDYFHRVSRFYNGYSPSECDKQYDNCLKSKKNGVTIRSFFEVAKQSGINISPVNTHKTQSKPEATTNDTPHFPSNLYNNLPVFLHETCKVFNTSREKDIVLLGTLTAISSCMHKVYGIYNNDKVYPNLYLYVTAPASAGKGALKYCKNLINHIHEDLKTQGKLVREQFQRDMIIYNNEKNKCPDLQKPEEPPTKLLFIPANISSTGAFQLLNDNEGRGIIFETEGDTLANSFKSDYGDYSDGFRKAFHHETISYYRRTNKEYVDILKPKLSAVLTGTPKQVLTLIPDIENGLFSRFMFYSFNLVPTWNNVFNKQSNMGFDDYFNAFGSQVYQLYNSLVAGREIEFTMTEYQQQKFNHFFESRQTEFFDMYGHDSVATVRRLGLIFYRITMILTTIRIMETGDFPYTLICSDTDFQNTLEIVNVLLQHSRHMFLYITTNTNAIPADTLKGRFLERLPDEFTRQEAVEIAQSLNIQERTADKYLKSFLGKHLEKSLNYGKYKKTNTSQTNLEVNT
jgi:hypothetical protein